MKTLIDEKKKIGKKLIKTENDCISNGDFSLQKTSTFYFTKHKPKRPSIQKKNEFNDIQKKAVIFTKLAEDKKRVYYHSHLKELVKVSSVIVNYIKQDFSSCYYEKLIKDKNTNDNSLNITNSNYLKFNSCKISKLNTWSTENLLTEKDKDFLVKIKKYHNYYNDVFSVKEKIKIEEFLNKIKYFSSYEYDLLYKVYFTWFDLVRKNKLKKVSDLDVIYLVHNTRPNDLKIIEIEKFVKEMKKLCILP